MKIEQANKKPALKTRGVIIIILLIAAVGILTFFAVWSFGRNKPAGETETGNDDPDTPHTNQLTVMQNEIESDETIFSINGNSIPMSVFRYYLFDSFSRLESRYTTNELNFNVIMDADMTLGQYVIKNSVDGVKFNMAVKKLAEELNIDNAKAEADVDEYLTATINGAFGGDEDAFREQLALMGTTLESFRNIMISQSLGSQTFEHYFGESWILSLDPSVYYDQFATASDILLYTVNDDVDGLTGERVQTPLSDAEIAQKRDLAEIILQRLNSGEDFFELLNEYGEDPSVMLENNPEQRHTFQRNDRIYEFSVAAFSTEVGEYSNIVETSHGYYIIYKLPLDTETVTETVKTQAFRSNLFNTMLDSLSRDYEIEFTELYESSSLDNWYREYKAKNY